MKSRPVCAVIGGGPAGLMAAERLAEGGARVTLYERMPSVGRKFLMAGIGGLNLTHSEALEGFLKRYRSEETMVAEAVKSFPPEALRAWCEALGEPTFVGSSGRVFPRSFKASPLLRAWLHRLDNLGVTLRTRCHWTGWDGKSLRMRTPGGEETANPDATVLALGGASWPKLGSDGSWAGLLAEQGVGIAPFRPSNCGFTVPWSAGFRERYAGTPLKSIALSAAGHTARGEAMISRGGIEGGAVYALSSVLRDAIEDNGDVLLEIDFRPDREVRDLAGRLQRARPRDSLTNRLRKTLRLPPVVTGLLRERGDVPGDSAELVGLLKAFPLRLTGAMPIARAISTAGGIVTGALDARFMVRSMPGIFVAGEMLDWEAPTGGYLLQASFATGRAAADGALDWLSGQRT